MSLIYLLKILKSDKNLLYSHYFNFMFYKFCDKRIKLKRNEFLTKIQQVSEFKQFFIECLTTSSGDEI